MHNDFTRGYSTSTMTLPFFVNKLGHDLLGLQIGVGQAVCTSNLLQCCPTIKKMDLVDSYEPYEDYIGFSNVKTGQQHRESVVKSTEIRKINYNSIPVLNILQEDCDELYDIALENLLYSGYLDSVEFFRMDSEKFLQTVENNTYDFIFLDAHLTYEQVYRDMVNWTPKLKTGGLLAVHDYFHVETYHAVHAYRTDFNIEDKLYRFHNDGVVWFKGLKNGLAEVKPNWI
jgi:hypothetical protein